MIETTGAPRRPYWFAGRPGQRVESWVGHGRRGLEPLAGITRPGPQKQRQTFGYVTDAGCVAREPPSRPPQVPPPWPPPDSPSASPVLSSRLAALVQRPPWGTACGAVLLRLAAMCLKAPLGRGWPLKVPYRGRAIPSAPSPMGDPQSDPSRGEPSRTQAPVGGRGSPRIRTQAGHGGDSRTPSAAT
jgi:hypothetical protein